MRSIKKQRKVTLAILSFALLVAVYLNWEYAKGSPESYFTTQGLETQGSGIISENDLLTTQEDYETENYGDAQLVATSSSDSEKYFEEARLSRQKIRDEALDKLQKTLKSSKLTDQEKQTATQGLAVLVENMTTETDIENLVKAKGFVDCVASLSAEKISLAVQTSSGELTKQDAAKIRDVVLSKTSITSQNIVIVEVK